VKPSSNGATMRLNVESGITKALLDLLPGGKADSDSADEN